MFLAALAVSWNFSGITSFLLLLSAIAFSVAYSLLRIKRLMLVKNISISVCYVILFFSCFFAFSNRATIESIAVGILIMILMFSYSVLSDIRDLDPDKRNNLKTFPTLYGYERSMGLVLSAFAAFDTVFISATLTGIISNLTAIVFLPLFFFQVIIYHRLRSRSLQGISSLQGASFMVMTALMCAMI